MLSAVIITKNEADTIAKVLQPLQSLTNDIVVIDSNSTDGTIDICKAHGARVIQQKWLGFSATKNFGHTQAKNPWILSLDADEVLSNELLYALKSLQPQRKTVYALDRLTDLYGTPVYHSGWYPDWKIRVFHRDDVRWEGDFVHETLHVPSDFKVARLNGKLFHHSYKDALDHLNRIDRYAKLAAEELYARGKKPNFIKLYLAPGFRWFKTYILKRGFLDGKAGKVIARRDAHFVRLKYRLLGEMWGE